MQVVLLGGGGGRGAVGGRASCATWGGGHVRPRGVSCARPAAFASWYNSRSRTRLPHQATPRITFASNPEELSCWRLTAANGGEVPTEQRPRVT